MKTARTCCLNDVSFTLKRGGNEIAMFGELVPESPYKDFPIVNIIGSPGYIALAQSD